MSSPHVAVLGSANMDLVATAARLPRKGETVAGDTFRQVPGGKGANQALAASRAGGSVAFAGAVGDDDFGRRLLASLDAAGVDTSAVAVTPTPTGTAHITVDREGANTIVVVPGANGTLRELRPEHRQAIESASTLLLQLELPLSFVCEAAEYAHLHGTQVVLTPAPACELPAPLLAHTELLVPNEHEATVLAGVDDPREAAVILSRRCGAVVMTMGGQGATYVRDGVPRLDVPAFVVEAVDTTAAGDTFVGVLAVALSNGQTMDDAMLRAAAAAALSVQRFGASTSMPTTAEIDTFMSARPRHT